MFWWKQVKKGKIYVTLWFQWRLESIISGKAWYSGRNQKLIYHIFITHRNREKEQKVGWSYKPSKPTPSECLPSASLHLLTFPFANSTPAEVPSTWAYEGQFLFRTPQVRLLWASGLKGFSQLFPKPTKAMELRYSFHFWKHTGYWWVQGGHIS